MESIVHNTKIIVMPLQYLKKFNFPFHVRKVKGTKQTANKGLQHEYIETKSGSKTATKTDSEDLWSTDVN